MPIMKGRDGWYWDSRGPFKTLREAENVAAAANVAGGKGEKSKTTQKRKERVQ